MSKSSPDKRGKRTAQRPHSSYSGSTSPTVYYGGGIQIQCQYCPGQDFRRSRLRAHDIQDLLLMRYPVRCLRCGQRQTVSFAVASISVPSHIKQRRHRRSAEKFPELGFSPQPQNLNAADKPAPRNQVNPLDKDEHLAS